MKKIISIFLALASILALLAFTACGSDKDGGGKTEIEYPDLVQSEYAGTEIEFMHFWQDADKAIQDMAKYFSEGTGIKVTVTLSPVSTHLTSLNTKMQTNTMPALYTMWPGATMPE